MATKRDAVEAWVEFKNSLDNRFKINRGIRFALTGDGKGSSASNFYYPTGENKIWAREYGREDAPFPVTNHNRVYPAVNIPIVLGYDDLDPEREQVLGVNYAAIPGGESGASQNFELGPHHTQHEWGGGDEVFIDGRQFLPGLVHETNPPSMYAIIKPFIYYYNGGFHRFSGGSTVDFSGSAYLPSATGAYRYVGVFFDYTTGSPAYVVGELSETGPSQQTWDSFFGIASQTAYDLIPSLPEGHYSLATVFLGSSTSVVSSLAANNLFDLRLHVDTPQSGGTEATAIGQIQISLNGTTFSARIPVTDKNVGLVFDSQSGYIVVN